MTDQQIEDKIDRALRLHVSEYHSSKIVSRKGFVPPTLADVQQYRKDCTPDLDSVDPKKFWKSYDDCDWKDTQGKPIRNWKLKMWTWARHSPEGIIAAQHKKAVCVNCGKESTLIVSNKAYCGPICRQKVLGW